MDYFSSELRALDLLHAIDSNIKYNENLDEETKEKHKFKVHDILMNRIEKNDHSKIINIKDPVEMLT